MFPTAEGKIIRLKLFGRGLVVFHQEPHVEASKTRPRPNLRPGRVTSDDILYRLLLDNPHAQIRYSSKQTEYPSSDHSKAQKDHLYTFHYSTVQTGYHFLYLVPYHSLPFRSERLFFQRPYQCRKIVNVKVNAIGILDHFRRFLYLRIGVGANFLS